MIASGTLERVLPDWLHEPQVIQAVYPSNRYIPKKVRLFVDGLAGFLRGSGALAEYSRALQRRPQDTFAL